MALFLMDPRKKKSGSTLENVAEDVLNGLFCHYEPPTSEYAQHKAANAVRENPTKYTFSKVKRNRSILRTSKQFRKKQAMEEAKKNKKKRGVTWRDEATKKGFEGRIEACASGPCDVLGVLTKAGRGLEDALSPSSANKKTAENPFPEPVAPTITTEETETPKETTEEKADDEAPKKVLYDDEGNPIDENGSIMDQENVPPPPTGMSQLRKLAKSMDQGDMFEPENYDNPKGTSQTTRKTPVRNPTPMRTRGDEGNAYLEDAILQTRSDSPTNDRDLYNRPGTPFRSRQEGEEYDSVVGRSFRSRGAPSPSRSQVFSEITMDEAFASRGRYPQSPAARTSEGVEVDMYKGKARARSRSPGQYKAEMSSDWDLGQDLTQIRSRSYDQRRLSVNKEDTEDDIREPSESKKSSRDKSRRHSSGEYLKSETKKSDKSRRTSAPLPVDTKEEDKSKSRRSSRSSKSKRVGDDYEAAVRNRDPTPRMSLDPTTEDLRPDQTKPLPPTPRRKDKKEKTSIDKTIEQFEEKTAKSKSYERSSRKKSDGGETAKEGTYDRMRKKYSNPLSPSSVATDDEIRAEVSSVGMESSTLRPIHYRNPFVNVPPPVMEEKSQTEVSKTASKGTSTLSKSTISTEDKKKKSQDTRDIVQTASSGSGSGTVRTKKLWKGWRNAIGRVKSIAKDIDDHKITPPVFPKPEKKADLVTQHPGMYAKRSENHTYSMYDKRSSNPSKGSR